MDVSIYLDDKSDFGAIEINDIRADPVLTTEFPAGLRSSQCSPKKPLGAGGLIAKLTAQVFPIWLIEESDKHRVRLPVSPSLIKEGAGGWLV